MSMFIPHEILQLFSHSKQPCTNKLDTSNQASIYRSIVKIEVATQAADYKIPWNSGKFGAGTGTGFLIGKNRFLTNAHVVFHT